MNINLERFGVVSLSNFIDLSVSDNLMIIAMRNHPNIKKWMYNSNDISEQEHFSFIDSLKNDVTKQYFLVKKGEHIIGVVSFTHIDRDEGISEFGLYANPFDSLKNKGSILQSAVISYAFNFLNLNLLRLEVFNDNEPAIKLYEKYSFQPVGTGCSNGKTLLCMELNKANKNACPS